MKSTMKRCLAFATVLAMLLSVCALPVFAVDAVKAEPCEHAADVIPETVIITSDDNTHSRYDKYECGECGAKWIRDVVLNEAHVYEDVVTKEATYPLYDVDAETGDPVLVENGKGVSTPICKICAHEDTASATEIPALVHSVYEELVNPNGCCVYTVVVPATCDAPGEYTYVCKNGGAHPQEGGEIPALGHDYDFGACDGETLVVTCANGCGGFTIPVVAELPVHENCEGEVSSFTRNVDCVNYGFTAHACDTCDYAYVTDYVAATGHNEEGVHVYTAQSCTADRVIVKYCTACVTIADNDDADDLLLVDGIWNVEDANGKYGLYEKEIDTTALKTGHYYMDGENKVVIDPTVCNEDSEGNGVTCAGCTEYFGHAWKDAKTEATCTENGATWKQCACGAEKDYAPIAAGHKTVETVTEATAVKDGVKVYTCEVCGEKTADDIILPAAYDIVFNATVANKYGADALIVNKSTIAYTITLNAAELEVYALTLNVTFDDAAMKYISYDLGANGANAFGAMTADNAGTTSVGVNNGVATVFAYSANYVDGELAPVVLDGEQVFVTLYFEVDAYAHGDCQIGISGYDAETVAGEHNFVISVDDEAVTSITVAMLGDLAGEDGAVTVDDQRMLNALIAAGMDDGAALYDARADINQDGKVDFADLYIVNQYLNTTFDYEDFLAGEKLA